MPLSSRLLTLRLHSRSIPLPYGVGGQPYGVTVADFNGDGKLDLAIACPDPEIPPGASTTVSILLGNGDGTFQTHVDYSAGNSPLAVVAGNFNGDGNPDLAVTNVGDNTVSIILLGNGDGT